MSDAGFSLSMHLAWLAQQGKELRFCVLGAGHGGLAMAGHLGWMGFPVSLYNRSEERLHALRWHGGIRLSGAVTGFGPLRRVSSHLEELVGEADVLMIVTPATAHRGLAEALSPLLKDGHLIVLHPGRTGGALEVQEMLRATGCTARVLVSEAQTFLYAARATSKSAAHIYRIKNSVPLASLPSYRIPEVLAVINQAFPVFVAGTNVLATSFDNIGAVFHPALTILNAGWIEATGGDFDYYHQGITPAVGNVLERIDEERIAVARGLGLQTTTARQWLYRSYDSSGKDLCEAIRNTDSYAGIRAPSTIAHRYIWEDVPMSLVPMASIGEQLGVPTPTIRMIIAMGSLLHARDYMAEGRSVSSLGLAKLSVKAIRQLVVGLGPVNNLQPSIS
jgi:opine dehydrogenase